MPLYYSMPWYILALRFVPVGRGFKYIIVYECETPEVADSPEWGVVRDTITPESSDSICPEMTHSEASP